MSEINVGEASMRPQHDAAENDPQLDLHELARTSFNEAAA